MDSAADEMENVSKSRLQEKGEQQDEREQERITQIYTYQSTMNIYKVCKGQAELYPIYILMYKFVKKEVFFASSKSATCSLAHPYHICRYHCAKNSGETHVVFVAPSILDRYILVNCTFIRHLFTMTQPPSQLSQTPLCKHFFNR
ncbi:hypothetical protein CBL_10457 [Carabus blaptoides fortunei]